MLLITARLGKSSHIDNLEGEIEIKVIRIDGDQVTLGVTSRRKPVRSYASGEIPAFLRKQAD